mgnify:CR=1 FL=1
MYYAKIIEYGHEIMVTVYGETFEEAEQNALASFSNVISVHEI